MLHEVEEAAVRPLEVLEEEHRRAPLRDPLEEDPPGGEEDVAAARGGRLEPQEREERRLHPAPVLVGRDVLGDRRPDPLAGRGLVVVLDQLGPAADHLAERPEGDPLPKAG